MHTLQDGAARILSLARATVVKHSQCLLHELACPLRQRGITFHGLADAVEFLHRQAVCFDGGGHTLIGFIDDALLGAIILGTLILCRVLVSESGHFLR